MIAIYTQRERLNLIKIHFLVDVVVPYTCDPSAQTAEAENCREFETNWGHVVSSRPAKAVG